MKKIIQFGENVEGYSIPVLNEREIRASAGILFLGAFISLMLILFKGNFLMIKYFLTGFLLDLMIRVFINPRFSPSLILGRLIVRNQVPDYVGAPQKRFAWSIGIGISALMFVLLVMVNAYSPITGIACLVCLIFLFFEAAFGICLGCKFYSLFNKSKLQHCPGEVCDPRSKHEIQRVNAVQVLIICSFIAAIVVMVIVLKETFSVAPHNMFK